MEHFVCWVKASHTHLKVHYNQRKIGNGTGVDQRNKKCNFSYQLLPYIRLQIKDLLLLKYLRV